MKVKPPGVQSGGSFFVVTPLWGAQSGKENKTYTEISRGGF
jgi:hypothetical protein